MEPWGEEACNVWSPGVKRHVMCGAWGAMYEAMYSVA